MSSKFSDPWGDQQLYRVTTAAASGARSHSDADMPREEPPNKSEIITARDATPKDAKTLHKGT